MLIGLNVTNCLRLAVAMVLLAQPAMGYQTGYQIQVVDCHQPKTVQAFQADSMCQMPPLEPEQELGTAYVVLQQPASRRIRGHSCQVKKTTFHFKCGAWSHLKFQDTPSIMHTEEISLEACHHMVNSRTYQLPTITQTYKLEIDVPAYVEVTERGSLKLEDDKVICQGETIHLKGTLHTNTVVLSEYHILVRSETYLVSEDSVESSSERVRFPCDYQSGGCITGSGTFVWSHYNRPCSLQIVRRIRPSRTLNTYLVDHEAQFLINTTSLTTVPGCPMQVTGTDHPTIFIAEESKVTSLSWSGLTNVDLALQSAVHLNYLSCNMERLIDQQDNSIAQRACNHHQLELSLEEPTHLGRENYGLRRGDVFYIFACQNRTARIREMDNCYTDIPIEPEGFVNPVTRQFIPHSPKIPCSHSFPQVVNSIQGWVELTPKIKIRPAPLVQTTLGLRTQNPHEDYSHGGLYSDTELADWNHQLSFPSYHQALLKAVTYGSCAQENQCKTSPNEITRYDLSNLVPDFEKKLNLWAQFKEFLHQWGDLFAFLALGIIGIKLLSDLVMISITMLRCGPAATIALVAHLYLYNKATYERIRRRHQRHQNTHHGDAEMTPLQTTATAPGDKF